MTLQQQLESARSHHQAGHFAEAEKIYREILAQQPYHADALYLLGSLAGQVGQFDAAIDLIRRAIALSPANASFYTNLGNALKSKGHIDQAIDSYRRAIQLQPDSPDACSNLSQALTDLGKINEAIAAGRRAIQLDPNFVHARFTLGNAFYAGGQLDEAIDCFRQAIGLQPGFADAHNNLGTALKDKSRLHEAVASYRQAICLNPNFADAHSNLGIALVDIGELGEAAASLRLAIRLKPDHAEALNNLGIVLTKLGQLEEAIASFRASVRLKPGYAAAHANLAAALADIGQLDDAIAALRHAIRLQPDSAGMYNNLGDTLKSNGQLDEAIAALRQAIRLNPNDADAHSNLIIALHYYPDHNAKMIYDELRLWNNLHAQVQKKLITPHNNKPDPNRKLRIGYISADFYNHASAMFILPLFRDHERHEFESFCYAQGGRSDGVTRQLMGYTQCWRKITGLSDEMVAAQIREDQIDILIDLKLHTAENRLLVFAQKPAPVQATWLGYPGSTGLDTIDYRLTDPFLDPPGLHDAFYSERSIRLPDTFWCYDPLSPEPPVNSLPRSHAGFITFGCLNNFCKINSRLLSVWAGILRKVDRSRLLILAPVGSARDRVSAQFREEGVDLQRIEFVAKQPRSDYLRTYHRIDIGLDAFPCNGHTTSLDSLWMGVPIITLVGPTALGRAGLSQLTNLGLPEFIAHSPEQYARIACELAGDLPRLIDLRRNLRPRMEASPLMDAPRFARNVEAAYRQIWRNWCAGGGK
jgi:protein O-GlcNAc transferase